MPFEYSGWDDFPARCDDDSDDHVRLRRLRLLCVGYAHRVVEDLNGTDPFAARCFAWSDLEIVVRWLFETLLHDDGDGFRRRLDGHESSPEGPFAKRPCVPASELESRLRDFDEDLAVLLDRLDAARDSTHDPAAATKWAAAELAAWVHGEILRMRPLCTGNLFAAYLGAWWVTRLCGYFVPIVRPRPDGYKAMVQYKQYDTAIGYSIESVDQLERLQPQVRDIRMAGFIASQIGPVRFGIGRPPPPS